MKRSESISNISKSLSAMQGEITDGVRDSKGGHGKYADLAQLLQIVRPLLAKHKMSFTQHPSVDEHNICLTSLLIHESGEWIESTLLLKIPPARGANESQAVGSGITYARRYACSSIFGISQEDDDGQYKGAVAPKDTTPKSYVTPKPAPKPVAPPVVKPRPIAPPKIDGESLVAMNAMVDAYMSSDWEMGGSIWAGLEEEMKVKVWGCLGDDVKKWVRESRAKDKQS